MKKSITSLLLFAAASTLQGCVLLLPVIEENQAKHPTDELAGLKKSCPLVDGVAGKPIAHTGYARNEFDNYSEAQAFVAAHRTAPTRTVSTQQSKLNKLVAQLGADTDVARTHAASDLGSMGPAAKSAVPKLAYALANDESKWVRRAAAKSLGKIGSPDAIEPLTKALRDENKWVAHSAQNALNKVRMQQVSRPRMYSPTNTRTVMYRSR
jgi:hypothetical protein